MIGINVSNKGQRFADLIVDGLKTIETRSSDSLHPFVGKRVSIIRTGEGTACAIGEVTITGWTWTDDKAQFDGWYDAHKVDASDKYYIGQAGKYLYILADAVRYDIPKPVAKYGMVSRKVEALTVDKVI